MIHILLIAVDSEIARLASRLIKRNGFSVDIITNPDETPSVKPGLIIFDCDMSPEKGLKKYDMLLQKYLGTKILWISSDAAEEVEALECGADDWVKKPLNVDVLLARIKRLCK